VIAVGGIGFARLWVKSGLCRGARVWVLRSAKVREAERTAKEKCHTMGAMSAASGQKMNNLSRSAFVRAASSFLAKVCSAKF